MSRFRGVRLEAQNLQSFKNVLGLFERSDRDTKCAQLRRLREKDTWCHTVNSRIIVKIHLLNVTNKTFNEQLTEKQIQQNNIGIPA